MERITFKRLLLAVAFTGVLAIPSDMPWAQPMSPVESEDILTAKVMGHLEHKGTVTTIYGGKLGFYYTIRSRDRRTIAEKRALRVSAYLP